jgi:hypothetical protein
MATIMALMVCPYISLNVLPSTRTLSISGIYCQAFNSSETGFSFWLQIASMLQKSWHNEAVLEVEVINSQLHDFCCTSLQYSKCFWCNKTSLERSSESAPRQMIRYKCDIQNPSHHLKSESRAGNFFASRFIQCPREILYTQNQKSSTKPLLARNTPPLPSHNKPLQNHQHPTSTHLPLTTPHNSSRHNNILRSRLPPPKPSLLVSQSRLFPSPTLAQTPLLFPFTWYSIRITCPRKPSMPTERQFHPLRSGDEELSGKKIRTG